MVHYTTKVAEIYPAAAGMAAYVAAVGGLGYRHVSQGRLT
jgi:hypothetical protein